MFVNNHEWFSKLNTGVYLDGEQWTSSVIQALWEMVSTILQYRKDFVHKSANKSTEQRKELIKEIHWLYQLHGRIDPCDQQSFATPKEQLLGYTNVGMEAWINRIMLRINNALWRTHKCTKQSTVSIMNYFNPTSLCAAIQVLTHAKVNQNGHSSHSKHTRQNVVANEWKTPSDAKST